MKVFILYQYLLLKHNDIIYYSNETFLEVLGIAILLSATFNHIQVDSFIASRNVRIKVKYVGIRSFYYKEPDILHMLFSNAFIMFIRYMYVTLYVGEFNLLCFYILGFEQRLQLFQVDSINTHLKRFPSVIYIL